MKNRMEWARGGERGKWGIKKAGEYKKCVQMCVYAFEWTAINSFTQMSEDSREKRLVTMDTES